ncbi:MAG: tetratricopeptide repeat protein [Anaerolineae bacterium]|nr:tetratricopeptide repeat protein [Anaerolineae bacterium]
MRCPNCQEQVLDLAFCPHCGHKLEAASLPDQPPSRRARRRAFVRRWILPVVLLLVVVAFGILGLALKGFRDGTEEQMLARQRQADIHFNRGEVWMQCGQYEMAEAEFQEALRLVPDYPDIGPKLELARLEQTVTPTAEPTATPQATPTTAMPTPTTQVIVVPETEVLFDEGVEHYQAQEWEEAIANLTQVRQLDSTYKTEEVVDMLFQSHYQYGLELAEQGVLEDAIAHFDAALYLHPRVQDIEDQRRWADLYSRALGVWQVDWERVIKNLTSVYIQNPEYKDTAPRLRTACITQAQVMVDQQRWCNAAELYEQAIAIDAEDETIVELESKTRRLCDTSDPLPLATPVIEGDWPPQGEVHVGTLIATCYDYQTDQSSICFQNAVDNVLYTWITQTEQPAVTLDGSMLAFRSVDPDRPGLYAVSTAGSGVVVSRTAAMSETGAIDSRSIIGEGGGVTLTTDVEAQYPTWSPDGRQVAYSVYDPEQEEWFIYVVDLANRGQPRLLRQGRWPNWGAGGLLAFTACNGENHCGIHIYDPVTQQVTTLTASVQDKVPVWSPSGDALVYMSDVGGMSSNLYAVNLDGYVWQITRNLSTDAVPVWSPDGAYIAYVTNHRVDWMIYKAPLWGDYMQKERLAVAGVEGAEWTRFRLGWIEPILKPADQP